MADEKESKSLVEEILFETKLPEEGYDNARRGLEALIAELVKPEKKGEKIQMRLVDDMIVELDKKLSRQLDQILHNPAFQKLESAWRGAKFLVDRTDFRENIKLEIISVSKEELLADFQDSPEIPKSGLYKQVYTREYGQFGGSPVGGMVANYDFGPG